MDELIIGKDYCVSDWSLEEAKQDMQIKGYKTKYIGNGKFLHSDGIDCHSWKYWVRADEEITPEQLEALMQKLIEPLVTCLKTVFEFLNKWAESEEVKALLEKINKENHPWT